MTENDKVKRRRRGPQGGPAGDMTPVEKAKDFKGAMKMLLKYVSRYRLALIAVILFSVCGTAFSIIGPKILSAAITELFNGLVSKFTEGGGIDFHKIGIILLGLLALYLVSALFMGIQGWIMATVTQKTGLRMRSEISAKIHRMPMKYFEGNSVGDILSRITNDVDTLVQGLNQSITMLITSAATIIGVIIMMLSISPLMTGIVFIILPISLLLLFVVMKISQKHFTRQQEYLGRINGQVEESVSGLTILKLFNHEERSKAEFSETNDVLFTSAWKSQFLSGLMMPIMNFIGNLGYVGIAISGGVLAFRGTITVGDIQAFIQYVRNFTQPISQLAQITNMMQSTAAATERVFEFLGEDEEVADAPDALTLTDASGEIDFYHVRFGYTPEKIIIKNLTEQVKPGMTVAIVGPTGAGKTTLVKLLLRFYDVTGGSIELDGEDIRTIKRASLREHFGMVLQDTWLFKGTIMENIRYGRPEATDEEVIEAAKAAYVHRFIKTQPHGYDTMLSEDAENISQGQRQLLTIARAILADRPVLILDEATSSVDTRTEERIQKAMKNLIEGRTSFVIAHRLSTIRYADLILVMREGDVVEQGAHEELLARGGFYAELYNSQFDSLQGLEPVA
jgi:ATP-binding cassette subfamily B protein